MASTKIGIAFRHGGIIPASVLKRDKDVTVAAHEAIEVPADYGQHLIDDKFAYAKDIEKVAKAKKAEAPTPGASPVSAAGGTAEIATAEKAVTDAEAEVTAAGDDAARKEAADLALTSAKAALEKLKG